MNKLELKHIAPYLPYEVLMARNGFVGNLTSLKTDGTITVTCSNWFEHINDSNAYKICLRPLSDLIKPCLDDGKIPMDELKEQEDNWYFIEGRFSRKEDGSNSFWLISDIPYWIIERLFEWHFDVFGLIEKGLAIDINSHDL